MRVLFSMLLLTCAMTAHGMEPLPDWLSEPLPIAKDSDETVRTLVSDGAAQLEGDQAAARTSLLAALRQARAGARISDYDYLWAYQGLMATCYDAANTLVHCSRKTYLDLGQRAFAHLDKRRSVDLWVFTEHGAALQGFCRTIGNNLAWVMHESPDSEAPELADALRVIERAESCIGSTEDYFVYDTKARILLKMGRADEAFALIRKVLDEVPDFQWFQEFVDDERYRAWQSASSPG